MGDFIQGLMPLMSRFRRFSSLLVLGGSLMALFFSYQLTRDFFNYWRLQARAPVQIIQWEIDGVKEKFALRALYRFQVDGQMQQGSFRLLPPYYWNEAAAVSGLTRRAQEPWLVWYDPKGLEHSALEKRAPLGLLFRTAICWSVLVYLVCFRNCYMLT